MKDLFYYQSDENTISEILYAVFLYWGKKNYIWNDLAQDFKNGSSYCSIPLELIFSSHNRKELIEKYCGNSINRNNKENIGKGLFLSKVKKYILPKDYEMLYEYDVSSYFISRDKATLIYPVSIFLIKILQENFINMMVHYGKDDIYIDNLYVQNTVRMAFELKEPLRLNFSSLKSFVKYHNNLETKELNKNLPTIKIPKNSIFKNLKMPQNCVRLTTRKQLVALRNKQNIPVSEYISRINDDKCSAWSIKLKNGHIFLVEIGLFNSNSFVVKQIRGYNNHPAPDYIRKQITNFLLLNN